MLVLNFRHGVYDFIVDVVFAEVVRHADGVADGDFVGGAVGDDGDAVDTHEGGASHSIGTEGVFDFVEGTFHEQGSDDGDDAFFDEAFEHGSEGFGGGFDAFEQDVAGEAVG